MLIGTAVVTSRASLVSLRLTVDIYKHSFNECTGNLNIFLRRSQKFTLTKLRTVGSSPVWLVICRHTTKMEEITSFLKKREETCTFSPKLLLNVTYNFCSASAERLGLRSISCHTSPFEACLCLFVCVCVCVCERERERARDRRRHCFTAASRIQNSPTPVSRLAAHSTARRLVSCVTKERKRATTKDTSEVMREACRITHWKRHSAEGLLVANLFPY